MKTTKTRLFGGGSVLPAVYAPAYGAPGMPRGPTIPRALDEGGQGEDFPYALAIPAALAVEVRTALLSLDRDHSD